jgi:hypothetical protein
VVLPRGSINAFIHIHIRTYIQVPVMIDRQGELRWTTVRGAQESAAVMTERGSEGFVLPVAFAVRQAPCHAERIRSVLRRRAPNHGCRLGSCPAPRVHRPPSASRWAGPARECRAWHVLARSAAPLYNPPQPSFGAHTHTHT